MDREDHNPSIPAPTPTFPASHPVKLQPDGTIICGPKRFRSGDDTIRRDILEIMARNLKGYLSKSDYQRTLIDSHFRLKPSGVRLITEPYLRRQNNVDKAISRLRHDLQRYFKDDLPEGTAWMCYSKKIDGWLLYRHPGLGCDGEYHW